MYIRQGKGREKRKKQVKPPCWQGITRKMESRFTLKATDRQAQALFDSTLATVKLIEFMGDKELYPDMDISSDITHKWRVILRHRDEIGEIRGVKTYQRVMELITR